VQQSHYSCLYLASSKFYAHDPFLGPFLNSMVYVTEAFFRASCTTQALRDEDISFPPGLTLSNPPVRYNSLCLTPVPVMFADLEKAVEQAESP
jgi:hypothetical protein